VRASKARKTLPEEAAALMKKYMSFVERKFNIGTLDGISAKSIEEHLKLYAGYVKHSNLILEKITEYSADSEKNAFVLGELQRRFGFEFDGMRNHEYYFEQFEGGASDISPDSEFAKTVAAQWGSVEAALNRFKAIAMTRGVGWAIMYYDTETKQLLNAWIDEQHLGHLTGLKVVVALDMWEHSYMLDYVPSEKKKYVDAFFKNINGKKVEERYASYLS
jgi:Fe-Mn family superoxide dismutase